MDGANGPENLHGLHVMGVLLILHGKGSLMCGFVLSYISSAAGVQLSTSSAFALCNNRRRAVSTATKHEVCFGV